MKNYSGWEGKKCYTRLGFWTGPRARDLELQGAEQIALSCPVSKYRWNLLAKIQTSFPSSCGSPGSYLWNWYLWNLLLQVPRIVQGEVCLGPHWWSVRRCWSFHGRSCGFDWTFLSPILFSPNPRKYSKKKVYDGVFKLLE